MIKLKPRTLLLHLVLIIFALIILGPMVYTFLTSLKLFRDIISGSWSFDPTLRNYEQLGLVVPQRTKGNRRLYSAAEVELLRKISRLTQELGVNLAGVEVILHMAGQIESLQMQIATLEARLSDLTEDVAERLPPQSPLQPS